ncbi:hypothetical protein SYNPS1DRAFT_11947 [Syncephalis pseudoplumigaleata]|uniref:Alpha/Beta hydrolase protein n=1 Tax=Syncephalis pseudoplumigaleata TaxID=1712513 RepID=A0A4P9Z634_9FUNG|nr:hypothetical protein SYNPS1DRAFT_11947 [Syncephalis pseudoplumigaleata]|eukprot:RKP27928.1 hypothetical protein SYNPS1DRAFT_11947 [Syncephalis pseudoplumigaleata]
MLAHQLDTPIRATWTVNDCSTETLWWPKRCGGEASTGPDMVLMFICVGNPGVIDYYTQFLSTVHELMDYRLDITSLAAQIEHKIACLDRLREMYPENTQFVLAAHSVGSYIALQVLDARPRHNIAQVICLFPTIQHIRDTPNGHTLHWLWNDTASSMTCFGIRMLQLLPQWMRLLMTRICAGQTAEEAHVTTTKFLSYPCICLIGPMARDEMETIKALQTDLIERHLDKLLFYYGASDNWSPISHYKEMAALFPEGARIHPFIGCPSRQLINV